MRVVLAFVALITLGLIATVGCVGSDIPDDVEWTVIGGMEGGKERDDHGGGNYRVQLNKPVSEDVLRAIGKDVRERHINICRYRDSQCQWFPELSTVGVWFYLPGMDTTIEAWGRAFFLPDEEQIQIIGNLQR